MKASKSQDSEGNGRVEKTTTRLKSTPDISWTGFIRRQADAERERVRVRIYPDRIVSF
ncbi:MAG: hypothetical protein IIC40_07640 [Candidatus Marinimicrobia bacterium]|nr:hypothetical protein [Candidatus Neomarinimicrobiota bacterium]